MPDRLTDASGELIQAINASIGDAGSMYAEALAARDRAKMQKARLLMDKYDGHRQAFFSLLEEMMFDPAPEMVEQAQVTMVVEVQPAVFVAEAPPPQTSEKAQKEAPDLEPGKTSRTAGRKQTTSGANPSAKALENWPRAHTGRVRSERSAAPAMESTPLVKGHYTEVKAYEPYLLQAMVLLGRDSRFIDIQKKTLELMQADQIVKPQDLERTGSTVIPRYISQTASLRKNLIRRELIVQNPVDKTFSLTPLGDDVAQQHRLTNPLLGGGRAAPHTGHPGVLQAA